MTANVFCILLGIAIGYGFPKAWAEATRADREEALRGVPRRGAKR